MNTLKEALANALDTKQMAEFCGCTTGDLKSLARKETVQPVKIHGRFLWEKAQKEAVLAALAGCCPNCGWKEGELQWDCGSPIPMVVGKPAPETPEDE